MKGKRQPPCTKIPANISVLMCLNNASLFFILSDHLSGIKLFGDSKTYSVSNNQFLLIH